MSASWTTFPCFVSTLSRSGAVVRVYPLPFSLAQNDSRWERPGIVDRYDLHKSPYVSGCLIALLFTLTKPAPAPDLLVSPSLRPLFSSLVLRIFPRCLVADHHRLAPRGKCRLHIHSLVLRLDGSFSRLSFRWVYLAGSAGSDSDSSRIVSQFSIDIFNRRIVGRVFLGCGCPLERGLEAISKE